MLLRFENICYILVAKFTDINLCPDFDTPMKSPITQYIPKVLTNVSLYNLSLISGIVIYISVVSLIVYTKYKDK